jgi:hypothetical protein
MKPADAASGLSLIDTDLNFSKGNSFIAGSFNCRKENKNISVLKGRRK